MSDMSCAPDGRSVDTLTGIIGCDQGAKGLLAVGNAQLDVVLSAWHQPEYDNNSLVGLLIDP